ncbi:SSI family serine proteinase inhibitor [Streptomyces hokutonensis]|uniref:SSI family serine proteinase inhibitor n=1 Tax=Streptomyces hokutonensis TaxID=1306990 RepID=UPI00037DF25B|nr:SSI family serine proteinase inhibitor [Streptomyces hokutonensis]
MLQVNRLLVIAAASAATVGALAATPATASPATARTLAPPPGNDEDLSGGDHLTVTVRHAGSADGTRDLYCHPGGGTHPDVTGACEAVGRNTRWGKDPFAPVPPDSMCTMIYGGPATAHVTGTWAGRPVDTTYDRSNGCEISRWNRMVPLLPDLGAGH